MHDAGLVGPRQGPRHLDGDPPGLVHRQRPARQPLLEGLALVIGHHDVEPAVVLADVVDGADVRIVEGRGGARLAQEAVLGGAVPAVLGRQQLDRHPAPQPGVLGLIDHAHAAGADLTDQPIGPELAGHGMRRFTGRLREELGRDLRSRRGQEAPRSFVRDPQGFHLGAELRISGARLIEKGAALLRRTVEHLVEKSLDPLPALGIGRQVRLHSAVRSLRTWKRKARALSQSRLTVRSEVPRVSAVSSSVSPAKNRSSTSRLNRSFRAAREVRASSSARISTARAKLASRRS